MRFIDFLYGAPVWQMGVVVSAIVVGGTVLALLVVDRIWNKELRRSHNDIAGFLIAVVGVIFAILISSLAITVQTRQDRAETLVIQEAEALTSIDRAASTLAQHDQDVMRAHLMSYLDVVIDQEWPQMQRAEWPTAARAVWNEIWNNIAALPVRDLRDMLSVQELRAHMDRLSEIRRGRGELATTGVDRVVWSVVLLGSVSTIVFAILFGVRNFAAHLLMTSLFAFTIALAMIMIIAIDWPYFGNDSVGPDPLIILRTTLKHDAALPT